MSVLALPALSLMVPPLAPCWLAPGPLAVCGFWAALLLLSLLTCMSVLAVPPALGLVVPPLALAPCWLSCLRTVTYPCFSLLLGSQAGMALGVLCCQAKSDGVWGPGHKVKKGGCRCACPRPVKSPARRGWLLHAGPWGDVKEPWPGFLQLGHALCLGLDCL